jgi:divalent metal cation (Fe/Co/Zn/Cd) transporter
VHIEVPDSLSASDIDRLSRKIQSEVYQKHQVALTAIGVYSMNTKDPDAMAARDRVNEIVTSVPYVLQMHGFYMNRDDKEMRFDIVVSFEAKNRRDAYNEALERVNKEYPDYNLLVAMDMDYSEIN